MADAEAFCAAGSFCQHVGCGDAGDWLLVGRMPDAVPVPDVYSALATSGSKDASAVDQSRLNVGDRHHRTVPVPGGSAAFT